MRIHRLELLRYGPFTGKVLNFRRDARLHVVYGPNEAGKSSSLAAIGDLFFGFPREEQHDFVHDAGVLRVGAEIQAQAGQLLTFRRRRGARKSIVADDDEEAALQEDALSPFLGNLNRDVFERTFGLNSDTLRDGGEAMLESEGELGAVLFAAASGLTGLARVRRRLDEEADALFAPGAGQERSFFTALERYDMAVAAERRDELKASEWRTLAAEIESIEAELEAVRARRVANAAELGRLRRLKAVQPLLLALDGVSGMLARFDDLPDVPDGFVAECTAALEAADIAGAQERGASEEVESARKAVSGIHSDESLFQKTPEIIEVFSRRGDYLSKLAEHPRLETEREEIEVALADIARRLGLRNADDVLRRMPSDAALETARAAIADGQTLEAGVEIEERRLAEEQATLEQQETEAASAGLSDPKPWRDQMAALAPELKQLEEEDELEQNFRRLTQQLSENALALVPPVTDLERLSHAILPSKATVTAHKTSFERLVDEKRVEHQRLEALDAERAQVARDLTQAQRSGPTAYADTINLIRNERDANFQDLRNHMLRTGALLSATQLMERIIQHEEEIAQADAVADRAIADAERLGRLSSLQSRLAEIDRQRPLIEARIGAVADEQTKAAQAYAALFAKAEVVPVGPDAMLGWLDQVQDLLALRREVEQTGARIEKLSSLAGRIHASLVRVANGIGLEGIDALPALALARLINAGIDDLTTRWSARLTFEGARQERRVRLGQVEDTLNRARRNLREWRMRFDGILPAIGLDVGTSSSAAAAALALWNGVPELGRQRANRLQRLAAIDRDTAAFEREVLALGETLAPEHTSLPAQVLIDVLHVKAQGSLAARARWDDARARLETAEGRFAAARAARGAAHAALKGLSAMLPEGADPRVELTRLAERALLRRQLGERRQAFMAAAEGMTEEEARVAVQGFDRDRAEVDAEDLARAAETLNAENDRLHQLLGQKQLQRDALETGLGSEPAAFERQMAETEISATARQWAVRKLAALLLGGAIEKHRESQADPLLLRASALFRTLTSGSFDRLSQDYGADDQPRLVGVRRNNERVPIPGMSEGTRDQLYLSLRLAYIEDYADRAESVPFIGDDIFQTFDDERTTAGVKALASTSALFQPILFTHHLSVVAIARRVLGDEVDYIEL